MCSRCSLSNRSAAYQPAVHRGEQFAPGVVQARICLERVDHAAGRLTGWRGVAEKPREGIRLQAKEFLKPGDGSRVRCSATFFPLPDGRWRTADGSGHGALRQARIDAGVPQGMPKPLTLSASAVHRPSIPDLLVAVQHSLVIEEYLVTT
jgi:hypothetical protein